METEESVMQCMEHVRESGLCNMFDGGCVAQVAEAICEDDAWAAMEEIVAETPWLRQDSLSVHEVEGAAGRLTHHHHHHRPAGHRPRRCRVRPVPGTPRTSTPPPQDAGA